MDKIVIRGGRPLSGEIQVSGAKNAALPILAAGLLPSGSSTFQNVPLLNDVTTMGKLLARHGCEVEGQQSTVTVTPPSQERVAYEAPYELVKTMRASVLVLGPLVARYGRARVSLPGGCAIGARPIDLHLKGLEAMGAEITLESGYVEARADRLRGAVIVCDVPTVTGTENLMMAASLAKGRTVIENAAREPEVEELAIVLNKMGARIQGAGTAIIQIEGVDELQPIEHAILPDRIEAGTFLVAAAITESDVLIRDARPEHLDAVLAKMRASGVDVNVEAGGIRVRGTGSVGPVDITTQPHPGFPTDMQAQFMVLACCADGQSVIKETIFENRFMHVPELARMGADVHVDGRVALIRGGRPMSGAAVMATDLRASASLVLAGLVAKGTTEVLRVYHLDRGYERIEKKLGALGADIERAQA
ncbi:UDP-N-acetylglucosamine 1-carboxyvinyltransferase [Haliangium ochraceum]|uniref:UDP-N-acetylglucosamine 1-carboxyvinyltransferase n=1 Tax=Haliangium ochraceum (strain DSM 14365 / JCM 11303 / SMP-2) TaxID=502025 RepID=D0LZH7_HALO1|nr:UDP-N-acetylglucosamine 1-carboxyvinyltransferase [Haliangium ochraceum]ACY17956.1 UDP-N-acetylglucosamine1-carboxyvinyltransferase [Haliangium ochraceum DSM 14365]